MMEPTVWRGFSELYGSWKTICSSRRNGRIFDSGRPARSVPSNTICPLVGLYSRVIARPRVWPLPRSKETPSTAWTICRLANRPSVFLIGKCIFRSRTLSRGAPDAGVLLTGYSFSGQARLDLGREDGAGVGKVAAGCVGARLVAADQLGQLGAAQVAGHPVDVRAARVEGAAGGQVDQARRVAPDRAQHLVLGRDRGDRLEQAPRVGVGRAG